MRQKIIWPQGKEFTFTIIDDTDYGTVFNLKPVYEYLYRWGIRSTKTVWVYPPRDGYAGQCLMDTDYEAFIMELVKKGFEIAFHNAGSGAFSRGETIKALELFTKKLGIVPRLHINHYKNIENIYWGNKRFYPPVQWLYNAVRPGYKPEGEVLGSPFFWGDICKKYMKYIRNRVFSGINTLAYDWKMPSREKKKEKYSNYWFSSTDGANINVFNKLLCKKNVDKLVAQGGCCIIYTHFANGFVDEKGELDIDFKQNIEYVSKKNGWFATATEVLDYLLENKSATFDRAGFCYQSGLDIIWLLQRIYRKWTLKI